jgi:two-component system, OmpR family, response regulator
MGSPGCPFQNHIRVRELIPPPEIEPPYGDGPVRILIASDDPGYAEACRCAFGRAGIEVCSRPQCKCREAAAGKQSFEVIFVDSAQPDATRAELLRDLHALSRAYIIVLSSCSDTAARVAWLEHGADECQPRTVCPEELVARACAIVRWARGVDRLSPRVLRVGVLVFWPDRMTVYLAGRRLDLTEYEFRLALALARHAGKVLTREQLLDLAKGSAEDAFDRSIDVQVSRLRKKLGDNPRRPRILVTVRGAGYMLVSA